MRSALAIIVLGLALAACGDRRSFDQRYRDTDAAMASQAQALDANLSDDNLTGPDTNQNR